MKVKKYWILLVFIGVFVCLVLANTEECHSRPAVAFVSRERDTLKGLSGVEVRIEPIRPEAEKSGYGLTTKQLQTDVELRLRQSGIRVLTGKERRLTAGAPYLYVNVNVVIRQRTGMNLAVYNIHVELNQIVYLGRDPTVRCYASTWNNGFVGSIGVSNLGDIRVTVKESVDHFINDYLAANPKSK